MPVSAEYDLLLDAIVPTDPPRADWSSWDTSQWGRTLRAADWHRVSPILFCHLRDQPGVPPAVLSALERSYLANAARSLFIKTALDLVLAALTEAGTRAMLLKGAALVETVYTDPAQREMLDIDILVPVERIDVATAALSPLGYRSDDQHATSIQLHLGDHHGPPLVGEERLVAVELHHHIAIAGEGRRFEIGDFWKRARDARDRAYALPSVEDLLLHVCLHFTRSRLGGSSQRRHTGGALGQICDIARVVDAETLDWAQLAATARSYGLQSRIFLALFAARALGVHVPDAALADLEPRRFDERLGRQLVSLRVLRAGDHLPVRTLRWMFAPSREVLSRGWNADPTATLSLARAYMRRVRIHAPLARSALRRPWLYVQDQRLNGEIRALEDAI